MLKWNSNSETAARKAVLDMIPKGAVGIEIGLWKGDFSAQILRAARPGTLHFVDPWLVSDAADRSRAAWYGESKISQSGMDAICE